MTHEVLVNGATAGHVCVLTLAVFAFLKYGFRSGDFRTWFDDTDKTLQNMRRRISAGLDELLKPIFGGAGRVVRSNILDGDGKYYEEAVDPMASEDYHNALFDFVENEADVLPDYRSLLLTRSAWQFWTRYLSWSILILMISEAASIGLIGGVDKLGGYSLPNLFIHGSILPTVFIVLSCFCGLCFSLFYHNRGTKYVGRYK
jgi:hypothetical protein